MTGAGAGSSVPQFYGLLSGGANVVVTTSRYSNEVTEYYQSMYAKYGASGSTLIVVPFNQGLSCSNSSSKEKTLRYTHRQIGSKQDVDSLVKYIFSSGKEGLGSGFGLHHSICSGFRNREIDILDSKSELAHRIMLTNLIRLLGAVKIRRPLVVMKHDRRKLFFPSLRIMVSLVQMVFILSRNLGLRPFQ